MAGRGRGAGRGMSFNIETLGFGRGESLPGPLLQPPPVFPMLEMKAVPLLSGEDFDYLLALKQEYRGTIRESPYFMKMSDKKRDIVRYSDKYSVGNQDNQTNWQPDWLRLPKELRQQKPKPRAKIKAVIKPKVPAGASGNFVKEDIIKTFEELEKKEENTEEDKEEEEEGKDDEEIEEEEYYEEDDIEENDYAQTYFDNGENYGLDEDDDLDEGPIY